MAQWEQIRGIEGVDVAAPIASMGTTPAWVAFDDDASAGLPADAQRGLLKVGCEATSRGGTLRTQPCQGWAYVTRTPFLDGMVQIPSGGGVRGRVIEVIDGVEHHPGVGSGSPKTEHTPGSPADDWAQPLLERDDSTMTGKANVRIVLGCR